MFKKKPSLPESSRPRNRVSGVTATDVPRNAPVFSYHASRSSSLETRARNAVPSDEQTPKRKAAPRFGMQHIKPRHVLAGILGIVVFLLLMGLSSTPKVVVLGDVSNQFALQDLSVYRQAAHNAFGRSIANDNKLTINTDAVAVELRNSFPELHAVSISLPFFGRQPTVYIQPATPQLVFSTASGQFILDSNGRALSNYQSGTKLPTSRSVPIVSDQTGIAVRKGDIALPSQSVAFITQVAEQLYAKQIKIDTWTLPAGGSQLNVKVSGAPYFVKFNLQSNAREETGTFLAAKNYLDGKKITPGQYIDARVTGRVYYK